MTAYNILVCAGIVPDPLQTLEPATGACGPSLKNEAMLPAVLDPWAMHALIEGANIAKQFPESKLYLISIAPKAKLQQVLMTIGQKVPFELIALDGQAGGWTDAFEVARILCDAIQAVPNLNLQQTLLFGGWESASRGAGSTMQILGEMLGITEQFQGVDQLAFLPDGRIQVLERIEGGIHQVSELEALPAVFGWATGELPEPPNNPRIGMMNMRGIMPVLQKAKPIQVFTSGVEYLTIETPKQKRETQVITNMTADEVAADIAAWLNQEQ